MRMIAITQHTTFEALKERLLLKNRASESAINDLKNLNPHVDFDKIKSGTILLIPESPAFRASEGSGVTGKPFDALREQLLAGVDASAARSRAGWTARLEEQAVVGRLLKSAVLKRAVESDPELGAQIEAALKTAKQDSEEAKATDEALKQLRRQATAELAALGKLLG